ncbi:MAG: oxidoreductase [Candidatus Saccharibacteria bacterium]|nr:oxidoreductase [Candidatus Saccharibacteria bacterium]
MNLSELINKMSSIFTMYKGISFGLLGIWSAAFTLSFFGLISYSPLAMVASLIVAVLSVYGASYTCGKLFGVHVHGESSLITGLILSLIISPSLDIGSLIVLFFAGVIAGVSKFIIVRNGRHIFNPAALAAFVIGVAGLGGASWWVATPVLTPIVLLVALISLYKSHRLAVAGVFLAVSIPILLIVFSMYGTTLLENMYLLLSWPLLFVAGVMLTEPLTLPPRTWQMYVEAGIVGVLFAVPLDLYFVEMTPALAILIGNLVSTIFLARENIRMVLKKRRQLTPTTQELVFMPNKPIRYSAGQYIEIQLPHKKVDFRGYRRSFSFTSAPEKNEVTLGVKFYEPSSSFKSALKTLPIGSAVTATGFWGDFVLPKDPATPITYVAGGIGITPFISHLKAGQKHKDVRNVVLVYAVNSPAEIAYKEVLVKAGIKVVIVTQEPISELPENWIQVKVPRITKEVIAKAVPDIASRQAYISGPTPFVDSAKKALRSLNTKHIKTDYFVGY